MEKIYKMSKNWRNVHCIVHALTQFLVLVIISLFIDVAVLNYLKVNFAESQIEIHSKGKD